MTRGLVATDLLTADVRRAAADWLGADASDDVVARVAWSVLVEPGDGVAGALIAQFGAVGALDCLRAGASARDAELTQAVDRWAPRWDSQLVARAIATGAHRGMRLVTPESATWPTSLNDLGAHAPVCLWVRGDPGLLVGDRAVGIVGARAATPYGDHVTAELSSGLAADGVTIVSGAAYGIDGAAHRTALGVDGRTIAIVAGGADRVYPAGHANLLQRIAETGAVVAECPPGTTPTRWRFLARNRLIAALTNATVVVEAGMRSGSINTAGHAASLGRPLGAVPGAITSSTSAGCHRLMREYDAVCITRVDDVRDLIGETGAPQPLAYEAPEKVRLADALSSRRARTVDELARRSGLAPTDVIATLGLMSLAGDALAREDGWVAPA